MIEICSEVSNGDSGARASSFDQLPASFLRTIIETANEGIWMIDADGFTTFVNDRMSKMLGRSPTAMLGLHPHDVVVREDLPIAARVITATIGGEPQEFEIRFMLPDGTSIPMLASSAPIRNEEGVIVASIATFSDLTAHKKVEQALRDSEQQANHNLALLNQLLEAATDAIWMRDPQGVFHVANSAACRIMGESHESIIGRSIFEIWGPEVGAHLAEETQTLFRSRQALTVEEEMFDAGRGGVKIFLSNKVPLFSDDGKPFGILGISRDITNRKRDEERELLLAREVDHRAKNLLAVVQSVVQLTQATKTEDLKAGIVGRIQSLARAHTLLSDARWDGAQLGEIVREELAPFLGNGGGRASVTGPPLLLRPAAAQSIAMVIHELATNAAKHGALSSPEGRLDVEWRRTPEMLELSWVERGGPPVKRSRKVGFGSKIIHASIERQLHGKLVQDWRPEGLRCTIQIKSAEALVANDAA